MCFPHCPQKFIYSRLLRLFTKSSLCSFAGYLERIEFLMQNAKLTLVLMAGLPGAGKTTLARILSRELKWHIIDKDQHKEVLLKQGLDEEKAGYAAYELSFATARDMLTKLQASVILDTSALFTF